MLGLQRSPAGEAGSLDPRSLMQGDFLRLNFNVPSEPEERCAAPGSFSAAGPVPPGPASGWASAVSSARAWNFQLGLWQLGQLLT